VLHHGGSCADAGQVVQVNGVSSARLQIALGVLIRSLGWVAFGLLMILSFTSLADLPRGSSSNHAHPLACVLAAGCWTACLAVSRWVQATGRGGWLLQQRDQRRSG